MRKYFTRDFLRENKKELLILVVYLVVTAAYKLFNRAGDRVYLLTTRLDDLIPFTKEFIIFYYYWYFFLATMVISLLLKDKEAYFKLIKGYIMGACICYIVYLFFQSTVPRPQVTGTDFLSKMVRIIYSMDEPYNCFPSLHVYTTIYGCIVISTGYFKDKKLFRYFHYVMGILITLSTCFVKQHVVADAIGALILACLAYWLICREEGVKLLNWIKKLYSSWTMKKKLET